MGVDNIITFDAHDPRVQNAIPLKGFETVQPAYQFIKGILKSCDDLKLDNDHLMIRSHTKHRPEGKTFSETVQIHFG